MRPTGHRYALGAACLLFCAAASNAAPVCGEWRWSGQYRFVQANGINPNVTLKQEGATVTASAAYDYVKQQGNERVGGGYVGHGTGTVNGSHITVKINWQSGATGVYEGDIGLDGRVSGITYDVRHPNTKVKWHTDEPVRCPTANAASTPAKPTHSLGKRPTAAACATGYVWREARPEDKVCVTPDSRDRAARENALAPSRWVNGANGPKTCATGFVWREAYPGDVVCVSPETRDKVRQENSSAATRVAG